MSLALPAPTPTLLEELASVPPVTLASSVLRSPRQCNPVRRASTATTERPPASPALPAPTPTLPMAPPSAALVTLESFAPLRPPLKSPALLEDFPTSEPVPVRNVAQQPSHLTLHPHLVSLAMPTRLRTRTARSVSASKVSTLVSLQTKLFLSRRVYRLIRLA